MGSLQYIDDLGTFHVAWDDGCGLGLVIGQDSFSVSPPPLQTLKLYMPMTATYYDEDDPEQDITMDSREAAQYAPQIINALRSERRWLENEGPEEAERGLMAYFDGPDSVDQKVQSCFFTAEVRDGQLWGVAKCKVRGELTPLELKCLTDEIGGQASDGVGESFEQREIRVGDGLEIYAHLWQSKGWSIVPERDRFLWPISSRAMNFGGLRTAAIRPRSTAIWQTATTRSGASARPRCGRWRAAASTAGTPPPLTPGPMGKPRPTPTGRSGEAGTEGGGTARLGDPSNPCLPQYLPLSGSRWRHPVRTERADPAAGPAQ